jgi:chemotaxis protein histidine kinase CheA
MQHKTRFRTCGKENIMAHASLKAGPTKADDIFAKLATEKKVAEKKAEQKPAEKKAAEQKAAERKAAEQKAAEKKAAEKKAAEQKAAEQKAAEQKAAEKKAAEKMAAEKKAAEKKAAEKMAAEQKAAEKKAAEKKAAEKKAAEQKAAVPSLDIQAFGAFSTNAAGGMHEMGSAWLAWFGGSTSDGLELSHRLLQCRTLQDLAETQRSYLAGSTRGWLDHNARVLKISRQMADEGLRTLARGPRA